MKFFLIPLLLLLFSFDNAFSNIETSNVFPELPGVQVRNIKFADSNFGIAIGFEIFTDTDYNGIIGVTENGGESWQISRIDGALLFGIDFLDKNNIIINGFHNTTKGCIVRSTDMGKTWTTKYCNGIDAPDLVSLYTVKFLDPTNILCAGYHGSVIKSSDGGNTWVSTAALGQDFSIWNLESVGNTLILSMVSVEDGTLYKYYSSVDNGITWQQYQPDLPQGFNINKYFVKSQKEIYGFGNQNGKSAIAKSSDVGSTWQIIYSDNDMIDLKCGYVTSGGAIIAAGGNDMDAKIVMSDNGKNWKTQIYTEEYDFWNMAEKDNKIYIATASGKLYAINIGTSGVNSKEISELISVFPNPSSDFINLSGLNNDNQYFIDVFTLDGTYIVKSSPVKDGKVNCSLSGSGVYYFNLFSNGKLVGTGNFIKK